MSRVPIPALCSRCGAVFPSAFGPMFGGNVQVTLQGNAETCPVCGGMAQTADGTFRIIAGEVVSVLAASGLTRDMLLALHARVKAAYTQRKPPEVVAQDVEQIAPDLGPVIRKSVTNGSYLTILLLILYLVLQRCSVNVNVNVDLDLNRFLDQMQTTPPAVVVDMEPPPASTAPPYSAP